MTAVITQLDESAVATGNGYRYDRTVEIAGRIVRARIERQFYSSYSLAFVDMINDAKSWTRVVEDLACQWWDAVQPAAVGGRPRHVVLGDAVLTVVPVRGGQQRADGVENVVRQCGRGRCRGEDRGGAVQELVGDRTEHGGGGDVLARGRGGSSSTPTAASPSPRRTATSARSSAARAPRTATTSATSKTPPTRNGG